MDPYVIDLPWLFRRMLVSLICRTRPARSAAAYASIWWEEGSPLIVISRRLQEVMKKEWKHGPVELAMRYGQPSIESTLMRISEQGYKKVTLVPLYPQFGDSIVTTIIEEAQRVSKEKELDINFSIVKHFYAEPEYLDALLAVSKPHLDKGFDHVLMSFHGLPERHLLKYNPDHVLRGNCCDDVVTSQEVHDKCYRGQCLRAAKMFAERYGIPDGKWSASFQSRLGMDKWIDPYTNETIEHLAKQGVKKLLVMCPAFVADCLESLEEIAMEGKKEFIEAGGEDLVLVPCLNDDPAWAKALSIICEKATPGL
eukprot:TRINITY_DN278_c0_g1_i1.p1 TRINITY_DN278_c0_g1~~TRINITY_DN278_c0_g1_i1.p1  ORF type:complete len:311 (-),score=44.20 TRINITY_DN278_c0_g1_i1:205-1137(-)